MTLHLGTFKLIKKIQIGFLGVLWSIIFLIFVFEKPTMHPTITADELKFIQISKKETDYVLEKDFVKLQSFKI